MIALLFLMIGSRSFCKGKGDIRIVFDLFFLKYSLLSQNFKCSMKMLFMTFSKRFRCYERLNIYLKIDPKKKEGEDKSSLVVPRRALKSDKLMGQ